MLNINLIYHKKRTHRENSCFWLLGQNGGRFLNKAVFPLAQISGGCRILDYFTLFSKVKK